MNSYLDKTTLQRALFIIQNMNFKAFMGKKKDIHNQSLDSFLIFNLILNDETKITFDFSKQNI